MKEYTERLKCQLTAEEINDSAHELAKATSERAELEQRKKEIDADLKAQIEARISLVGRLAGRINNGYEYRDVPCTITMDEPGPGLKEIVRNDTGETVRVDPMKDSERQQVIDLE